MYIAAARNALYTQQGRASGNIEAARVREMFSKDQQFSDHYNKTLMNGKWNHMINQTHIGYSSWMSPIVNTMPAVTEIDVPNTSDVGIAAHGSDYAWPDGPSSPGIPEAVAVPNSWSRREGSSKDNWSEKRSRKHERATSASFVFTSRPE